MATRTVHAVCSHDCPDSCAVLVTVDELSGKATRVAGDPSHPVTRGFLCGKVAKYLDRVYSPDRLLYPMRRRKGVAKGPVQQSELEKVFERISWDDALNEIAARLKNISDEHGPESILPYSYAGTIGQLGYGSMDRRFFHRLGASQLDRTICSTTGGAAFNAVYGMKMGPAPEDFAHAKLIIAWGANIHGNNVHLWPFIEEARRNGAKLIVIDPYKTRTAALADWHITIHPGTDAALALAMMHVILRDGMQNDAYIAANTHGFAQLAEHVRSYTPEFAAAATGISAAEIEKLARMYMAAKPAAIRMNYGIQRSENGGASARAVAMLPLLTGAWMHRGGGVQLSTSGAFPFNSKALQMPELMLASPLGRNARVINMSSLGGVLTEENNPPVKALFVYNSNPAAIAPNQSAVLRGMARADLFTVVHEQFLTDTADYADILLPAPSFLEVKDVQGAYGHYFVQISQPAIAPLGESQPNWWLFGQLAQRMGFPEACFRDTADELIDAALKISAPAFAGITRERLEREQRVSVAAQGALPFSDAGWFRTPSGRGEFYSEAMGADALPTFHAPTESRYGTNASEKFPLEMLARKADNWMNSTFANIPTHQTMEGRHLGPDLGLLEMHADDATPRGIRDGDTVEVWNSRGSLTLRAHVNGSVQPGVVATRMGWNKLAADGKGVNALTSERLNDLAGGPTFYSTLVEARRLS